MIPGTETNKYTEANDKLQGWYEWKAIKQIYERQTAKDNMNVPDSMDMVTNNIKQVKQLEDERLNWQILARMKHFKWMCEGTGTKRLQMHTAEILLQHTVMFAKAFLTKITVSDDICTKLYWKPTTCILISLQLVESVTCYAMFIYCLCLGYLKPMWRKDLSKNSPICEMCHFTEWWTVQFMGPVHHSCY